MPDYLTPAPMIRCPRCESHARRVFALQRLFDGSYQANVCCEDCYLVTVAVNGWCLALSTKEALRMRGLLVPEEWDWWEETRRHLRARRA